MLCRGRPRAVVKVRGCPAGGCRVDPGVATAFAQHWLTVFDTCRVNRGLMDHLAFPSGIRDFERLPCVRVLELSDCAAVADLLAT